MKRAVLTVGLHGLSANELGDDGMYTGPIALVGDAAKCVVNAHAYLSGNQVGQLGYRVVVDDHAFTNGFWKLQGYSGAGGAGAGQHLEPVLTAAERCEFADRGESPALVAFARAFPNDLPRISGWAGEAMNARVVSVTFNPASES